MSRSRIRRLTTRSFSALAGLTMACSTSSAVREREVETPASTTVSTGQGGTITIGTQTQRVGRAEELNITPESAYGALAKAYDFVGIEPLTRVDRDRTLGNAAVVARRQLNGERLSLFVDCGAGPTLANLADSYELRMSVMSTVAPAEGSGSRILTRVDATARPVVRSGAPVNCTSTGELERRIAEHVRNEAVPQ